MKCFSILYLLIPIFSLISQTAVHRDFTERHLNLRYQIEYLDGKTLKLTDRETGLSKYVDISDQNIDVRNIKTEQVFDLINEDTTLYNWKFTRRKMFPVGCIQGYPMIIGDFNHNGHTDLAGTYKIPQNIQMADCAVLEVYPDTSYQIKKIYQDSAAAILAYTDVDNDNLFEFNLKRIQHFTNYESTFQDSLPDSLNFIYQMWQISSQIGAEVFGDFDKDNITDVLYVGDDSLPPHGNKIYIAEYDASQNNFIKKFRYSPPDWNVYGFSVGDFDQDGFTEFATGSIQGDVFVWENTGNDSYSFIFSDTINAPNAYMTCATNDIDNNGKPEFFVGGSAYYMGIPASRVYWFEADANNHYQKMRSFFLLGTDVLGNTVLYNSDVDSDGKDELVFCFSGVVVILKWNSSGYFDLFYLDWWENWDQEIHGINVYNTFGSNKKDLFVGVRDIVTTPRIRSYFYANNTISGIQEPPANEPVITSFILDQNYPNPFNGITTIKYQVSKSVLVNLIIYDLTGKEVIRLIDEKKVNPGEHQITWNGNDQTGKEVSSGIYFYVLTAGKHKQARKMVVLK
jgi:hypothetical protein